jgi:hypothetical protein
MKIKVTLVTLLVFALASGFAFAGDSLISVNGQWIENDGWVKMVGNVPYGLVGEFADRAGATVSWLDNAHIAVVNIGENYITFTGGDRQQQDDCDERADTDHRRQNLCTSGFSDGTARY